MNLFADIHLLTLDTLKQLQKQGDLPQDLSLSNLTVEPPRDPLHGDMASNAAMVLAKPAGLKPRDLAEKIAEILRQDHRVTAVDVAGPGFLNITLSDDFWVQIIPEVLSAKTQFGRSKIGQGKRVNVEYVSANPTGPLHVGHTRGAVFGDALANLLDFAGYSVTREYYVNDGGAQVDALARSVYLRYQQAHGRNVAFEDGTYPGDYLKPLGEALKEKYGTSYLDCDESVWLADIRAFATEVIMQTIRDDLESLGVRIESFFSERSLYGSGKIEAAINALKDKGLIYTGTLPPPKGKLPKDWEARAQLLFKSTDHGDDVDRPVQKADGSWTYFAPDIAYHYDKIERGFDMLINVFGADHGGYVKRMKAAVSALSDNNVFLDIKLIQLVNLLKDGQPFKMSKRAGTFVGLREVVDQVGAGVTRFVMLTRKNDAPLDFDFAKVLEQSKDNPVFYVQYANARLESIFRKAADMDLPASPNFSATPHHGELDVIKKVAQWPRLLELAAKHNEPHRIAFYLYELASSFHSLWNMGKDNPDLRFLQDDAPVITAQKIALLRAVQATLHAGLSILGVQAIDEM